MTSTPAAPATVAVLGVGEAGSLIAADLVADGTTVRLYDPAHSPAELTARVPGAEAFASEADAVAGADVVLSVNSAHDSETALRNGLPRLGEHALWLDLNTSSPGLKARLATIAAEHGRKFVDVALMTPVPGRGLRTPALLSGPDAASAAEALTALGGVATVQEGPVGAAAQRKLLRSVFFKGLAAAVCEALDAAEKAGCADWLHGNIADQLTACDADTVDRLVEGSRTHAVRREHEMRAAAEMLDELGVEPRIARAAADSLHALAAEGRPGASADHK